MDVELERIRYRGLPQDDTTATKAAHASLLRAKVLEVNDPHEKCALMNEAERIEAEIYKGPTMTGTVVRLFEPRGFAFVKPDDGSQDIFAHVKDFTRELPFDATLLERRVEFEIDQSHKGPQARNVRPI